MSRLIEIDICSNCKQHAWCTRHNESTYSTLAEELKRAILNQIPDVTVKVNLVGGHKMGSFQVYYKDINLFSKLSLGYFPHVGLLTTRIINFFQDVAQGNDLQKYKYSVNPVKHHPTYSAPSSKFYQNASSPNKANNLLPTHQKKQSPDKFKEHTPEQKKQPILQIHKEPKNQSQKKVPNTNKKENKNVEENSKHHEQIIQKKKTEQKHENITKVEEPKISKLKTNENKQEEKLIHNVEGEKTNKSIKAQPKIQANEVQHHQEKSIGKQTKKSQAHELIADVVQTKKKTQINHQHSKKQEVHTQKKQAQEVKYKTIDNSHVIKQKSTHQQPSSKEDNHTKTIEPQNNKQKTVNNDQVAKPAQNSHKQVQQQPQNSPTQEVHLPVQQKVQVIPEQVSKDHAVSQAQQAPKQKIQTHPQEVNNVIQTKIETVEAPQAAEPHVEAQVTKAAE